VTATRLPRRTRATSSALAGWAGPGWGCLPVQEVPGVVGT